MKKCSGCDYVGDNFSPRTAVCRPCKALYKRERDRLRRELRDENKDPIKRCKLCGESGDIFEDSRFTCRSCRSVYHQDACRTKIGHIKKIYGNQKRSSKLRGHSLPGYSLEGLIGWIMNQETFHHLYDKWCASGYDKWDAPSVDRIDNSIGYNFDNIRLMTFKQNADMAHKHCKEGKLNTGHKRKEVSQYTLDGVFIKTYPTMRQAEIAVGGSCRKEIRMCCDSGVGHARGYHWKYTNPINEEIVLCAVEGCIKGVSSVGYCHKHYMRFKRHGSTDLSTVGAKVRHVIKGIDHWSYGKSSHNRKEIINVTTGEIFESISDAAEKLNLKRGCIRDCLSGYQKTSSDFVFKYLNENENKEMIKSCNSCGYVGDNFSPQTSLCRPCKAKIKRERLKIQRDLREAAKDPIKRCKSCGESGDVFDKSRRVCKKCRNQHQKDLAIKKLEEKNAAMASKTMPEVIVGNMLC